MHKYLHAAIAFLLCITLTTGCSDSMSTGPHDNTSVDHSDNASIDCPTIPFEKIFAVSVVDGRNGKQFTVENSSDIQIIIDEIRPFTQLKGFPADHALNGYYFTLKLIGNSGTSIETLCLMNTHSVRVGEVVLSVDCSNLIDYLCEMV